MAKYYVESGNFKLIVNAADARRAALWAVHRALEHILPGEEEEAAQNLDLNLDDKSLGLSVALSERGFDREDATRFDTLDVVNEWSQLMSALSRMQSDLQVAENEIPLM